MPVMTYRTLDLNNVLQLVNNKKSLLKACYFHNRSRNMAWIKIWDAASIAAINFGVTPSKMTLSASSSFLANGTEYATNYSCWDLEFKDGIVIAATMDWRDADIQALQINAVIANILWE